MIDATQHSEWDYSLKGGPRYTRVIDDYCYTVFKVFVNGNGVYHYDQTDAKGRTV